MEDRTVGEESNFNLDALRHLFSGVVPEKESEFIALLDNMGLHFERSIDMTQMLEIGAIEFDGSYVIKININFIFYIWISSYLIWESYCLFDEEKNDFVIDKTNFNALKQKLDKLKMGIQDPNEVFPDFIPNPEIYFKNIAKGIRTMPGELASFGIAWVLLHEMKHLIHIKEGTSSIGDVTSDHEEEYSCDRYATEYLLEGIEKYCNMSNENSLKVRAKREMGIFVSLFSMTLLSEDAWSETSTHPSLQNRIDAVICIQNELSENRLPCADIFAFEAFSFLSSDFPKMPIPFKNDDK